MSTPFPEFEWLTEAPTELRNHRLWAKGEWWWRQEPGNPPQAMLLIRTDYGKMLEHRGNQGYFELTNIRPAFWRPIDMPPPLPESHPRG